MSLEPEPLLRRLLIVDEDVLSVEKIQQCVLKDRRFHYEFLVASNMSAALDKLRGETAVDLLIIDRQVCEGESWRTLETLAATPRLSLLPTIVLSAGDEPRPQHVLEFGLQDFYPKDVVRESVFPAIVANSIDRSRLLKELMREKQAVAEAERRAEEANQAKSAFLTGMSHELRTPLTAVIGLVEVMLEEPDSEDRANMLEMIRSNGQYLTHLLGDLLELAKIEVGKSPVNRTPCDIVRVTRDLCDLMRPRALDEGLTLSLQVAPDFRPNVFTDAVRYRQIVMSLIGNALKYTREGGVALTLRHGTTVGTGTDKPSDVQLLVHDTGQGIAPDLQPLLFQPFVQGDTNSIGVGLGLSVSRSLARVLGGDLKFIASESGPDTGSTFLLELPTGNLQETETRSSPATVIEPTRRLPDANSWLGKRILVAEDTRANQFLLRRLLLPLGVEIVLANDGQEAVAQFLRSQQGDQSRFHAILMDMQMPIMDGYEATRKLRHAGYRGVVVALTAAAMAGDAEKCLKAGCDAYITKPFNRASLLGKLDSYLLPRDREAY